jgi:hypothetical protein
MWLVPGIVTSRGRVEVGAHWSVADKRRIVAPALEPARSLLRWLAKSGIHVSQAKCCAGGRNFVGKEKRRRLLRR